MEETVKESDSHMTKGIVDQILNNLLNETRTLKCNSSNLPLKDNKKEDTNFSQCLLEVENKRVPDIKLELEQDDFQIELLPHFKENTFVSER